MSRKRLGGEITCLYACAYWKIVYEPSEDKLPIPAHIAKQISFGDETYQTVLKGRHIVGVIYRYLVAQKRRSFPPQTSARQEVERLKASIMDTGSATIIHLYAIL